MALTKEQKARQAKTPGQQVGQSRDQVHTDDANPATENLASPGQRVMSGRKLPNQPGASAPKAAQRQPGPSSSTDDSGTNLDD